MERNEIAAFAEEERAQVRRAEELIARQEALIEQLPPEFPQEMIRQANEVLAVLRQSLDIGRKRLARLEAQLAKMI